MDLFSRIAFSTGRCIVLIIIMGALLWGWTCGFWDLWGPDEARYVLIGKELLSRANWLLLTVHGQPYDEKPPLVFWVFAWILKLNGGEVSSWALRLPSVLSAIGCVIVTYFIGRSLFNARCGLIAALVLMTSSQFWENAPCADLNMNYTFWTILALGVWLIRDPSKPAPIALIAFAWVSLCVAFFIKGPLALLIFLGVLIFETFMIRRHVPMKGHAKPSWGHIIRKLGWIGHLVGLILLLGMVQLWRHQVSIYLGDEFVSTQLKEQTVDRFLKGDHGRPFWYYLPRIFTSIAAPWGILLIPAGLFLWRRYRHGKTFSIPSSLAMSTILAWLLIPLIFLSIMHGKRQMYLLPLIPAMALIIGYYLDKLLTLHKSFPKLTLVLAWLEIIFAILGVLAVIVLLLKPHVFDRHDLTIRSCTLIMALLISLIGIGIGLWTKLNNIRLDVAIASLIGCCFLAVLYTYVVINPVMNMRKSERFLGDALDEQLAFFKPDSKEIGAISSARKPEYHVYGHYRVLPYTTKEWLALTEQTKDVRSLPEFVVIRNDDLKEDALAPQLAQLGYDQIHMKIKRHDKSQRMLLYHQDERGIK